MGMLDGLCKIILCVMLVPVLWLVLLVAAFTTLLAFALALVAVTCLPLVALIDPDKITLK